MPTSLIYIVLSTRGCSPWRPAAVMSTTRYETCMNLPRIFKGRQERTGHPGKGVLCLAAYPISHQVPFRVGGQSKRKENSSQGPCRRLQVRLRCRVCVCPYPSSGILTGCPFDRRREVIAHIETELPYLLGSTNPCPTAVHMEPFSTSVFKVLI